MFTVLTLLDGVLFRASGTGPYELGDDHMLARSLGHLPAWMLLAAVLTLVEVARLRWLAATRTRWLGWLPLVGAVVLGGIAWKAEGGMTAIAVLGVGLSLVTLWNAPRPSGWTPARRAWAMFASAAISGIIAEVFKRIVGRERPFLDTEDRSDFHQTTLEHVGAFWVRLGEARAADAPTDQELPAAGTYVWKEGPFVGGWMDDYNLGFPSSHTAVAAGALFLLVRFFPTLWPVAIPLVLLTGWQRMDSNAHFATDVFGGLVIGLLVSRVVAGMLPDRPASATPD